MMKKPNIMKKITILMIMITAFSSCSNMESDAEKVCDLTTQTMEMMPKTIDLSMKAGFGDEESKKEAQKQLDKLEADIKKTGTEIDNIKSKYDEDEFQAYLLENCEAVKGMTKMGEALQGLENSIENN
jgi:peptidoglycan hydrolase CwlO-like protein